MSIIDKIKMYFKQAPLVVIVIASAIVLSVVGFFVLVIKGGYKPSMTNPPVVGVFGGTAKQDKPNSNIPDGVPTYPVVSPATNPTGDPEANPTGAPEVTTDAPSTAPDVTGEANPTEAVPTGDPVDTPEATPEVTDEATPTPDPNAGIPTQYTDIPIVTPRTNTYQSTGKKALTTDYPWVSVEKDWFSDAVCIGDSRVEDFCLFSNIGMDCYYDRGLAIFHVMTNKVIDKNGNKNTTVTEVFSSKQYKKIYICEGLNECAYASTENYYNQYKAVIEQIQALQPNAIIYIMSTMYVTKRVSDKNDFVNNDNVDDKNRAVAALANGKDIFYIDINDADTTDSNGALNPDDTEDGEHLAARSVWKWDTYLKNHAVKDETLK